MISGHVEKAHKTHSKAVATTVAVATTAVN